jgi:hypothetical protein
VFVEGILDAQLVAELQNARGVSMAGAGRCIIDAGGSEEVNHYLALCSALGKTARRHIPQCALQSQTMWDKAFVLAEATGTPVRTFLGTEPTGRGLKTISIDMFIIKGDKTTFSYHVENWIAALKRVGGK